MTIVQNFASMKSMLYGKLNFSHLARVVDACTAVERLILVKQLIENIETPDMKKEKNPVVTVTIK